MKDFLRAPLQLLALTTILASCAPIQGTTGPAGPANDRDQERPGREETPRVAPPETGQPPTTGRPTNRPAAPRSNQPALRLADEVRALWVVRTTLTSPESIRAMVDRAADAGFNTLLVQVRGRGDAYYNSRWEPKPRSVLAHGPEFDPLALVLREAHARGLGVHAWVNAHLIGGVGDLPSDPTHLIRARPDLLAVPKEMALEMYRRDPFSPSYSEDLLRFAQRNTDIIEGMYTAPSHPEVKEHIYGIWMDLAESYDLDGIHFDYVRYPSPDFDYSAGALNRFREWVLPRISPARQRVLDQALRSSPLAYVDSLPGPWSEFRRAQITDLVERIYHGVKKRKPSLVVSAAVFANADDAFASRFQNWRGWLADGVLDAVAPMAYTSSNEVFQRQIQEAVEIGGRERVWAGIGVYQNTYRGTVDKIRIAEDLGTRGVVLFSYDWAVTDGEGQGGRTFLESVGAEMFRR